MQSEFPECFEMVCQIFKSSFKPKIMFDYFLIIKILGKFEGNFISKFLIRLHSTHPNHIEMLLHFKKSLQNPKQEDPFSKE